MTTSAGLIKTVIPIELPAQVFCSSLANCTDTRNLTAGSVFFVDGSADLISPPTQAQGISGEQSVAAYYSAVPGCVQKAKGTLIGPNHNDVQEQRDCSGVPLFCVNGVYGYLGYPTAWMLARLQGDNYAAGAFVKHTGEIFHETKNWNHVASNIP